MHKYAGMQIEFSGSGHSLICNLLQHVERYVIIFDEKDNVVKISEKTAVQFAKRNAVWVKYMDFQIRKLTNVYTALFITIRQRNKTVNGNNVDL